MTAFAINATVRTADGKGAARRLRAAERVPAIIYSKGKPAESIAVEPKQLAKALLGAKRRNQLIELQLTDEKGASKGSRFVMTREVQIHPVRRSAVHVDFHEVDVNTAIHAKVPLETVGKSKAVVNGARLQIVLRTLNVSVKPGEIPEKITYDTTDSEIGVVRAKAVQMPAGVTLLDNPELPVLSLRMPRGEKAAEETPAAAAPAGKKK
ncbi:MAG TPA: 50S ribosomal protein L25 [Myxococcota bacterium]